MRIIMKNIINLRKDLAMYNHLEIKANYALLAKKHDMDWRTVKKYNQGYEGKTSSRNKPSYLDKYHDEIRDKLKLTGAKISAVYQYFLQKDDKIGGYPNFYHFIKKNKFEVSKTKDIVHPRYETEFGEQLQFDWKEDLKLINKYGEIFEFNVFSAILSASRLHFYVYSRTKTGADVKKCLVQVFRNAAGVTKTALTDNMSSILNTKTKKFYPDFLQFCKDMGTSVKSCKVRSPETKGKVEVSNKFLDWLVPYNGEFETELDLIKIIESITKKVNSRPNATTGIAPILLFAKEKEYLLPLPCKEILDSYMDYAKTTKVSNGFLVRHKGSEYSVPPQFINKAVELREVDGKLHIYHSKELISCHEIKTQKINYHAEHYSAGLKLIIGDKDEIAKQTEKNLSLFERICT